MFKVNTTKLESTLINPLSYYQIKVFNPLKTRDFIFLRSNNNSELNNDYEFLFIKDNLKYYKLNLTRQYSNIIVFEINHIKFNLTDNINQMRPFEFYYNQIENYIIFVI